MGIVARRFLQEKLPGEANLNERFLLKRPTKPELAFGRSEKKSDGISLQKETVEKTRQINLIGGNYFERGHCMDPGDIKNFGQINIADRIDKVVFNENLGISKEDLGQLKQGIKNLPQEEQTSLKRMFGEMIECDVVEERQSIVQNIRSFLQENGVPIAQSLTAGGILELIKLLFIGG
jgi:hypothetical protein